MSGQPDEDDLDETVEQEILRRQASRETPVPLETVREHLGL